MQEALALVSLRAFTASKRLNKKYNDVFLLLIEQVQEALALVSAGAFTASKRLNKKYKDVFFIIDRTSAGSTCFSEFASIYCEQTIK